LAYYRLYIFRRGHIATFRAFEAADDGLAVERGRELANGEAAELWSGARHIRDYRSAADLFTGTAA
jgi:hypothetical protein